MDHKFHSIAKKKKKEKDFMVFYESGKSYSVHISVEMFHFILITTQHFERLVLM